jgi:acyl-CoA reductase-like NAD-dependent aldehyde dehydrogenase
MTLQTQGVFCYGIGLRQQSPVTMTSSPPQSREHEVASARRVVQSFAPLTGELLGEVPVMSSHQVREVVDRARAAQEAWAAVPIVARAEQMLRFRDCIVEHSDELATLLARENGKPKPEAMVQEIAVVADLCTFLAKEAERILAVEERSLRMMPHRKSFIHYIPRGVVGVIGPWNYPLQLPLRDLLTAVIAGNAAVVKPSEVTPLIMVRAKELWDQSGMPPDLFGVVTGYGQTGAALVDAGIDMCLFTGSVRTGRRVASACGERLIPCVMELGGKAPLLACSDCDIERTADAIVFGGFANAGQVCISVERVYAHRGIYQTLVLEVEKRIRKLRLGDPVSEHCDIGGIAFAGQIAVAEAHIEDALNNGARLVCGGHRGPGEGQVFLPTLLIDCNHDCTVMKEEIFGPIVPMMQVSSEEEAIQLANDSRLGLNAYVFSEDPVRARALAEQIEAGSVLINDVLLNGGLPETPFGGIKQSGFGRVLGPEGLRAMCHTRHICEERIKLPKNPVAFPYTKKMYDWVSKAVRVMYTQGGLFNRLRKFF